MSADRPDRDDRDDMILRSLEQLHDELRAFRADHSALRDRVLVAEGRVEDNHQRLNEGAEAFSKIRQEIGVIKTGISPTWKMLGALVMAAAIPFFGVVWWASRSPDAGKFDRLVDRVIDNEKAAIEMNNAVNNIAATQLRTETKVDSLLGRPAIAVQAPPASP